MNDASCPESCCISCPRSAASPQQHPPTYPCEDARMPAPTITRREGRFSRDRLAYRVWEVDNPKAIIVIAHGYAEHSGRYDHVAAALGEAGFTSWALDHFGHGKSEGDIRGSVGTVEEAIEDLDEFVRMAAASAPDLPVFLI